MVNSIKCHLIDETYNPENMGTFNYYGTQMKDPGNLHKKLDIESFEAYGNVPNIPYVSGSEEENWEKHNSSLEAKDKYKELVNLIDGF